MKNINFIYFIILILFITACTGGKQEKVDNDSEQAATKPTSVFSDLDQSIFVVKTYDDNRILETGQGFLITPSTLVAPFSLFANGADKAIITPLNGTAKTVITEFYVYDRINNLILLKVDSLNAKPLKLYGGAKKQGIKTTIVGRKQNNRKPLYTGSYLEEIIIEGRELYSISNTISKRDIGTPVFLSNGTVLGIGTTQEIMYEMQYFAIPISEILDLMKKRAEPKKISKIGSPNATRNSKIKNITLVTDYGDIIIRLYNETPAYRDNFVQLAEEGYYDGLLIHRVIRDFGIQTGAADTRHAKSDDVVGWKGPGYTIPAHIIPSLYHKRGAIGSPRKPDDKNHQRRSDGSQFYIVTGRKYTDKELDEFEKENNIKFTAEQRKTYKTVGGAPHLDGSYTVFGEVISGLDIANRMTLLPVKGDFRPISDIRLKKVIIK